MDTRYNRLVVQVALALTIFATTNTTAETFSHPGSVVEGNKGEPLSVDVKAWAGTQRKGQELCPIYGEQPLDSTTSNDSDGSFQLRVMPDEPTYTVTYCKHGYFPRTDRSLPNHKDGTPVIPIPAKVFPRQYSEEVYDEIVQRKVIAAINDLFYLQEIDPQRFDRVLMEIESQLQHRDVTFVDPLRHILEQWGR